MRMTILQAKQRLHEKWMKLTKDGTDEEMMQALNIADTVLGNYDENLKVDMIAMFEELKKEMNPIKECEYQIYGKEHWGFVGKCQDIIQQKIKSLKEKQNERN